MMLHEVNAQRSGTQGDISGQTLGILKSSKVNSVRIPEVVSTLPNGEPVDFGRGNGRKGGRKASNPSKKKDSNDSSAETSVSRETSKKTDKPSTENGEKARNAKSKKKGGEIAGENGRGKKKQLVAPSLPNGERPNFSGEQTINKQNKKQGKATKDKKAPLTEETYAGSSFHSSPAALNLPKPSFKTSPKQPTPMPDAATTPQMHFSPVQNPTMGAISPIASMNMPPNYIPHGLPLPMPPQGFPHYAYPMVPPHHNSMAPPPHSMVPLPFQQPYIPAQPPRLSSDPHLGQRISFNELLGKADHD